MKEQIDSVRNKDNNNNVLPRPHTLPSLSPVNSAEEQIPNISMEIITEECTHLCDMWVGFYKKGSKSIAEVLDLKGLRAIFDLAGKEGINDDQPIMISESHTGKARFFYLLPEHYLNSEQLEEKLRELQKTFVSWSARSLGFYFDQGVHTPEVNLNILEKVLAAVVESKVSERYFLLLGDYNQNNVLNCALNVKKKLLEDKKVEVLLFH